MRDTHRDAVGADGQRDAEPVDERQDGLDEPLPLDVRLVAVEDEEGRPLAVSCHVDRDARTRVLGPALRVEDDGGPLRPVVDQLVGVEGDQTGRLAEVEDVLERDLSDVPGVDEPAQRVDEHGPGPRLVRREPESGLDCGVDRVELLRIEHGGPPVSLDAPPGSGLTGDVTNVV